MNWYKRERLSIGMAINLGEVLSNTKISTFAFDDDHID